MLSIRKETRWHPLMWLFHVWPFDYGHSSAIFVRRKWYWPWTVMVIYMAVLTLANYLHHGFHIDNSYGTLSTIRMIHDTSGAICYIVNALWDIVIDCETFTQFFGFVSKVDDFVLKKIRIAFIHAKTCIFVWIKLVFRNIKLFVIAIGFLRWFTVETSPEQGTLCFLSRMLDMIHSIMVQANALKHIQ